MSESSDISLDLVMEVMEEDEVFQGLRRNSSPKETKANLSSTVVTEDVTGAFGFSPMHQNQLEEVSQLGDLRPLVEMQTSAEAVVVEHQISQLLTGVSATSMLGNSGNLESLISPLENPQHPRATEDVYEEDSSSDMPSVDPFEVNGYGVPAVAGGTSITASTTGYITRTKNTEVVETCQTALPLSSGNGSSSALGNKAIAGKRRASVNSATAKKSAPVREKKADRKTGRQKGKKSATSSVSSSAPVQDIDGVWKRNGKKLKLHELANILDRTDPLYDKAQRAHKQLQYRANEADRMKHLEIENTILKEEKSKDAELINELKTENVQLKEEIKQMKEKEQKKERVHMIGNMLRGENNLGSTYSTEVVNCVMDCTNAIIRHFQ